MILEGISANTAANYSSPSTAPKAWGDKNNAIHISFVNHGLFFQIKFYSLPHFLISAFFPSTITFPTQPRSTHSHTPPRYYRRLPLDFADGFKYRHIGLYDLTTYRNFSYGTVSYSTKVTRFNIFFFFIIDFSELIRILVQTDYAKAFRKHLVFIHATHSERFNLNYN